MATMTPRMVQHVLRAADPRPPILPAVFPDDTIANGPTIVSTASLQAVCEWFPSLTLDEVRLRFRTALEIDGVPAFWEDQLFGEDEPASSASKSAKSIFEAANPCARCPVPPRDPFTGISLDGFQKRFTQQRESTLPSWSPRARFDHFYRFAPTPAFPSSESTKTPPPRRSCSHVTMS